MKDVQ